ncbi:HMG-Y-related protein A-like [Panicum miliaceum]|uniref:HMG-Y-related protein A-like n=1 Tax=Panicum miliaceum TaxID=4540 RepID=A0A3L6SCH3_PANMI|nr:HMG-Y-related protein A-like [Panicum miliaceum]
MIVAAIAALAEENGSSQAAIARRIEAEARSDLPASHPALVAAHLSRMSAAGELVAVAGGKYALPPPPPPAPESPADGGVDDDDCADEEEAPEPLPQPPAKRGRGRPPKVRPPGFSATGSGADGPVGAPGAAASPPAAPRRRGRPPKPRDPHAPPKIPRPRGRPRKNPLPEGMAPRPRPGAPTTAKAARPQFAEVGFV